MTNVKHFQATENTRIYKSFHGWKGETSLKVNGQDWQITTMKRSSGVILSTARAVQGSTDGSYMYEMFEDKCITLLTVDKVATESTIKAVHFEALAKFDSLKEVNELPEDRVYEIKPGQLLRFEGYGHFMDVKYVVYEIENGRFGKHYKCIDLIEQKFCLQDRIQPASKKFGIGTYYVEGEMMGQDEMNNLIIEVAQLTKQRELEQEETARLKEAARLNAIAKGKNIITGIPNGVKAVIIGELMVDDSDSQTDYFACHTEKVIYLAFSNHTRDLFEEMRKAATNSNETSHLIAEEEHREKYSGGQGYYIGAYRSGWRISKRKISTDPGTLEALQLAAGEGRYFIPTPAKEIIAPVQNTALQFIDYSERAFAIVGDTKPIKEQLKELGGKFNAHLTCGVGWIFSKSKLDIVKNALGL